MTTPTGPGYGSGYGPGGAGSGGAGGDGTDRRDPDERTEATERADRAERAGEDAPAGGSGERPGERPAERPGWPGDQPAEDRPGYGAREGVPTSGAPQVGATGATGGPPPMPSASPTPAMPPAGGTFASPGSSAAPAAPPSAPRPAPAAPSAPGVPGGGSAPSGPAPAASLGAAAAAAAAATGPFGGAATAGSATRPAPTPPQTPPQTPPPMPTMTPPTTPTPPRTAPSAPSAAPSGSTTIGNLPGGAQPLRGGKPRRARLVVRRIDPWSVLKFTLLFSLCLLIVFVVAVSALYYALDAMGVFEEVNDFVRELTQASSGGRQTGGVEVPFTASRVIGVAVVIGLVNVVIITAISTLGAFLYNLCADIVGGIELTLAERE